MDLQEHAVLLESDPAAFARLLLTSLGLPAHRLRVAQSWSNHVWPAPEHVVRVSSGRFRDAFLHEQKVLDLLPDTVPHAEVVAHGRVDRREWMVMRRIRGRPLIKVWSTLSERQRRLAVRQMGSILQDFHFANMLWDGTRITALLDFEGTRLGPPDMELDTLLRSTREP